jgi:ubiquinone/menaquinone biosynthesis C-methylase UbiE
MQRDWDLRARVDAFYFVDATRPSWDPAAFYERGRLLVEAIVEPVLRRLGTVRPGGRVLEIGCGLGRLFEGLAAHFDEVVGIDVSAEMLARGRGWCPVEATWLLGDGRTLQPVADASIRHVVSYEVLQHVPTGEVVQSYVAESYRVLEPGGTMQLHLRRGSDSLPQAVVRALPRPFRSRAVAAAVRTRGLRLVGTADTWLGCIIRPSDARRWAQDAGFEDIEVLDDPLHRRRSGYWLLARKPRPST